MDPATLAMAISGGTSIINNLLGRGQSKRNVDRTIAANRELAEYAYSKDLEMWNRQNMYNAPKAQMGRLRAAGLNPHLVYGSGKVAGNTSGEMPQYNKPTESYAGVLPIQVPNMIREFQDVALKEAKIDNTQEVAAGQRVKNDIAEIRRTIDRSTMAAEKKKRHYEWVNKLEDSLLKKQQRELNDLLMEKRVKELKEKDYDIIYKKYRNDWAEMGFTGSDNIMFRFIVRMLTEGGDPFGIINPEAFKIGN